MTRSAQNHTNWINEHLDISHYAKKNQQNYCRKCITARKTDTFYITGRYTIQKNGDSNVSLELKA